MANNEEAKVEEVKTAITDEELLELFKSADPDKQNAALAALKGEAPQGANPMAAMMSMFGGMMGGGQAEGGEDGAGQAEGGDNSEQAKAFFANMMGGGNGEGGGGFDMSSLMSMFGGMMGGGEKKEAPEEAPKE